MTDAYGPPYWVDGDFESVNGFPRYPAREMRRRHSWLDDRMATHDLQAIVVGGSTGPLETSVQFFTNWPPQVQSYSVFAAGEAPSLLVRLWNHLPDAHRIAAIERVTYGGDTPRDQALSLAGMLRHMGARRVGLIGIVPHGDLAVIRTEFPALELIDLNDDYRSFRLAKSDDEMVFVEIASRMNDAAVAALACELRPGIREYEVAKIVEDVYLAHRAWNLIHFSLTTPMRAPQICVPHQYHPDRTIAAGDVFVTEISTTFWGYAGQILRTFTIGEPPTPRYADLHAVALDAYSGIVGVLAAGATVGAILDAAEIITDRGYDIWDDLVHGFGGAYLPPIVRTRASRGATHGDDFEYPDGALIVVQPNVIDGDAGVQVGNSMRLEAGGARITQAFPTELIICE